MIYVRMKDDNTSRTFKIKVFMNDEYVVDTS